MSLENNNNQPQTSANPSSAAKAVDGAAPKKTGMFILPTGQNVAFTFILVSSLFLLWGFCNGMIDVMDKHFQEELKLTLAQSANVQFAHYLGYFLMALPAGYLASKLGYRGGIIAGLLLVAVGGFWFIPATRIHSFWAFLLGVCTIAAGLTFLETVANPYTTVLGDPKYSASRINLAQSCNGIGWILGPIAGAQFFYGKDASGASTGSQTLWIPYAGVAVIVILLSVVFYFAPVPDVKAEDDYHLDENGDAVTRSIWSRPHFILAVVAQFFYVAAQSGIFAFAINYLTKETPAVTESVKNSIVNFVSIFTTKEYASSLNLKWFDTVNGVTMFSSAFGAILVSVGSGCFLAGRFTGAAMLRKISAHKMLGVYALANVVVCGAIFLKLGWFSVFCIFLSYFFMSIMFPTIFALGIFGLGKGAKTASSFIVMAIMGGALVPKVMGSICDKHGISYGFIVPLCCFVIIAFYGFFWSQLSGFSTMQSNPGEKSH